MKKQQNQKTMIIYKKYRKQFIVYCAFFFVYGAVVNCLGPLIPYLAENQKKHETSYSILFISRASGYLIGSVASKYLQQKCSNHTLLAVATIFQAISSLLFTIVPSPMIFKCIILFINGWGCAKINMFLHACIIFIYKFGYLQWYLIIAHGAFGMGGLVGPLLVYFLGYSSYLSLGMILLIGTVIFFKIQSPQFSKNNEKSLQIPMVQDIENPQQQQQQKQNIAQMPKLKNIIAYLMCPIFVIIVGQQSIYSGWISSYAVMSSYTTKQSATIFSSIFWMSTTCFRFLLVHIKGTSTKKILTLFMIGLLGSLSSLLLIHNLNHMFGLYFSAFVFGLSTSILYALGLSLSQDYNLHLTPSQSSNFILCSAFGCVLTVSVGQFMQIFGPDSMFYFLGIMCMFGIVITLYVTNQMKKQNKQIQHQNQKIKQMKEIILSKKQTTATS